nr:MAG TPA: hypothetical protein [Caudoviricetes sp.]
MRETIYANSIKDNHLEIMRDDNDNDYELTLNHYVVLTSGGSYEVELAAEVLEIALNLLVNDAKI